MRFSFYYIYGRFYNTHLLLLHRELCVPTFILRDAVLHTISLNLFLSLYLCLSLLLSRQYHSFWCALIPLLGHCVQLFIVKLIYRTFFFPFSIIIIKSVQSHLLFTQSLGRRGSLYVAHCIGSIFCYVQMIYCQHTLILYAFHHPQQSNIWSFYVGQIHIWTKGTEWTY